MYKYLLSSFTSFVFATGMVQAGSTESTDPATPEIVVSTQQVMN